MKTMKSLPFFTTLLILSHITCQAEDINGTWRLSKSVDYENPEIAAPRLPSNTLRIVNHTLILPSNCLIKFHQRTYAPDRIFQMLMKSGENEATINQFSLKHFNIKPNEPKIHYQADPINSCNTLGSDFLISQDKLVTIRANSLFYAFTRIETDTTGSSTIDNTITALEGLKPSLLPFNTAAYITQCAQYIPNKKGMPQSTMKCAPTYFPYIASKDSRERVSRLIGSHAYHKRGARHGTEDYDNPVANGLHPVFLVFPPLGDVILVRVDDIENTENRDAISGAYISIKNNKVVDQLNEGCNFDIDYVCSTSSEKPIKFQLTKEGKFRKIN